MSEQNLIHAIFNSDCKRKSSSPSGGHFEFDMCHFKTYPGGLYVEHIGQVLE